MNLNTLTIYLAPYVFKKVSKATQVRFDELSKPLQGHFGTFDFTPTHQGNVGLRTFTGQPRDFRIPFARDNNKITKYNDYQSVSAQYNVECTYKQSIIAKTSLMREIPLNPATPPGQLISDLQQSPAYTEVKTHIPVNKLINDLDQIDNDLKTTTSKSFLKLIVEIFNTKLPTAQREVMEKNISDYLKNDKLNPEVTHIVLKQSENTFEQAVNLPTTSDFHKEKYVEINEKIKTACNALENFYKLPRK